MPVDNGPDPSGTVRALASVDRAFTALCAKIAYEAAARGLPVSIEQFYLLHAMTLAPDHTVPAADLAEVASLPRSTISDALQRLEAAGLLTRSTVGHDRRRVQATLTQQGETLVEVWAAKMHDITESHIFGVLSANHYASTLAVARTINAQDRLGDFAVKYLVDIENFTPHEPPSPPQ